MFKWLREFFSCGESTLTEETVVEEVPCLRLKIKKLKYGYRPYVYDKDNLVWMCPDYFKTERGAISSAQKYFCQQWNIV